MMLDTKRMKGSMWIWAVFIAFIFVFAFLYFVANLVFENYEIDINEGDVTMGAWNSINVLRTFSNQFGIVILIIGIVVVIYATWKESQ